MCVVSMVIDAAQEQWPAVNTWQPAQVQNMSEIIRKLGEIDKKLGAKDCYDPKKQDFLDQLDKRLKEVERKLKVKKL